MDNGEPGWGSRRPVWNSWKPGWDSGELCWTMESLVGAVEDLCGTVGSLGKTLLILCGIVRILSVAVGIPDGTGGVICQEIPTISLITHSGLLIFRGKKSKISRDFQGQIRGKIGQFCGKKVKIRGKIGRFRGIFAGEKSNFEGFSGANS